MPDSVKCLRYIKSDDEWFSEVPKRGWPGMSKIGKKIPCRSCLTEAIVVIWKKIVRFEIFDEVGVEQSFKNLSNSRSESNRAIVGGVGEVTLLRNRLNKCLIPRRRICAGNKNEEKKTTKNMRQFISKFLQKSGRNTIRAWRGYRVREGLSRKIRGISFFRFSGVKKKLYIKNWNEYENNNLYIIRIYKIKGFILPHILSKVTEESDYLLNRIWSKCKKELSVHMLKRIYKIFLEKLIRMTKQIVKFNEHIYSNQYLSQQRFSHISDVAARGLVWHEDPPTP